MPKMKRREGETDQEFAERQRQQLKEYRASEGGKKRRQEAYNRRRANPEKVQQDRTRNREWTRKKRQDPAYRADQRTQGRARWRKLNKGGWPVPDGATCELCGASDATETERMTLKRIVQDHDHDTGALRGFLCGRCNRNLGILEADPDWTARALEYVERWKTSLG